ncbi:hypothetical protein ACOSP7_010914 [Xanthoceras sorbifolium]
MLLLLITHPHLSLAPVSYLTSHRIADYLIAISCSGRYARASLAQWHARVWRACLSLTVYRHAASASTHRRLVPQSIHLVDRKCLLTIFFIF